MAAHISGLFVNLGHSFGRRDLARWILPFGLRTICDVQAKMLPTSL